MSALEKLNRAVAPVSKSAVLSCVEWDTVKALTPVGSAALWLSVVQVSKRLGVSVRTVWRLLDEGFPKPRYVRAKMPRWNCAEVDAWMSSRPSIQ